MTTHRDLHHRRKLHLVNNATPISSVTRSMHTISVSNYLQSPACNILQKSIHFHFKCIMGPKVIYIYIYVCVCVYLWRNLPTTYMVYEMIPRTARQYEDILLIRLPRSPSSVNDLWSVFVCILETGDREYYKEGPMHTQWLNIASVYIRSSS